MKNKIIFIIRPLPAILVYGIVSLIDVAGMLQKYETNATWGTYLVGLTNEDYSYIITVLLLLIGYVVYHYLQRSQKKNMDSIVTQHYGPPGIRPGIAGYLENNKFDSTDLLALILDRGARGLIEIESIPSGHMFVSDSIVIHKIKDIDDPTSGEAKIWTELFENKTGFNFDAIKYRRSEAKRIQFFRRIEEYMKYSTDVFYKSPHLFSILEHIGGLFGGRYYNSQGKDIYRNIIGYREFIKHIDLPLLQDLYQSDPLLIDSIIPWAISFELTKSFNNKLLQLPNYNPQWYKGNDKNIVEAIEKSLKSITRGLENRDEKKAKS